MERLINLCIFDHAMNVGKETFLTGPCQIGKATFARNCLAAQEAGDHYFNWDDPSVTKEHKRNPLFFKKMLDSRTGKKPLPMVFDEIHKLKNWRNILKGIYVTNGENMTLLVTGSARLGWYRKSGDSLVGRYFAYQMLPVSVIPATNFLMLTG